MPSHSTVQPRAIHWIGTMSLGIIWGSVFMSMAVALEGLSALWVAAGRLALGAVTLMAIEAGRDALGLPAKRGPIPWRWVLPIALLSTVMPFTLLTLGLLTVPSAFAGVSMAAVALFIMPLAHFFVPGERLTPNRVIGVLAGFVGVMVLIGPGIFAGADDLSLLPGRLACLAAAMCYGVSSIMVRLCPPVDPVRLTTLTTSIGAAVMVPVALVVDGVPPLPALMPMLALVWVGIFPTAIANLLRVLIVRSAGPVFMTQVSYLVPFWAVLFGVVLLGEPLRPSMVLAMAMILGGIAVSQWQTLRKVFTHS